MAWEAQKAATDIRKGVNEIRCIVANTTLNLCSGGRQEVREAGCLEVALTEDDFAYRGSVEDVGLSTSIPSSSISISGMSSSVLDSSMSA